MLVIEEINAQKQLFTYFFRKTLKNICNIKIFCRILHSLKRSSYYSSYN